MKNEEWIWVAIAVLLLLLTFDGLGIVLGFIKDILLIAILVLLVVFIIGKVIKKGKRKR